MAESIEGWKAMLQRLEQIQKIALIRRREGWSKWQKYLRDGILETRFGKKPIDDVTQAERLANNIIEQVKWRIGLLEGKGESQDMGKNGSIEDMLTMGQLLEVVPLARTSIWRLEKAGMFPKRIHIGRRKVAWRKDDIAHWISNLK